MTHSLNSRQQDNISQQIYKKNAPVVLWITKNKQTNKKTPKQMENKNTVKWVYLPSYQQFIITIIIILIQTRSGILTCSLKQIPPK